MPGEQLVQYSFAKVTSAPQVALGAKSPPASAGDARDPGSSLEPGKSLGGAQPTPVCLPGGPHGQRSLWARVLRVAKGQT